MTLPVPTDAVCSYNGYTFGSMIRSRISGRPRYDEAGRSIAFWVWTIHVEAYIAASNTDTELATIRETLTQPAGILIFRTKGFGGLEVNSTDAGQRDGMWGPKPTLINWTPLGDKAACLVTWECEVAIPECGDDARYEGRPAVINWEQSWVLDVDYYSVVTTTGYVEIPITRRDVGDTRNPDNAERFWDKVAPKVPYGFRRRSTDRRLSKDRRRLDFNVVDEELPAPLPDGTTQCEASHSIESTLDRGFRIWSGEISATITMPSRSDKGLAYSKFMLIVADRINLARDRVVTLKKATVLVTRFLIREDIFGRTSSFALSFRICGTTLAFILKETGLWTQVAGTDFGTWKASLDKLGLRGGALATFKDSNDAIIDLCANVIPKIGVASETTVRQEGEVKVELKASDKVNADASWLKWDNRLSWQVDERVIRHTPLAERKLHIPRAGDVMDVIKRQARALSGVKGRGLAVASKAPGRDTFQHVGGPRYCVRMVGSAARLGHRIPMPVLISVGGIACVLSKQEEWSELTVGAVGDVPLYSAKWSLLYELAEPPKSTTEMPADPLLNIDPQTLPDGGPV